MDLPRTARIASRLEVLPHTGSTNADLRALAEGDPDGASHLTVLLTSDQRTGRGRLDRAWNAPGGSALAVSVLLRVADVAPAHRGWIPLIAGLAMSQAVAAQLAGREVSLKWPNDVLVAGSGAAPAKICGILAEATGSDAVIVGTGVNTAMTAAQAPVPTATSFAMLGAACDEDLLVASYLEGLERSLAALRAGDAASIRAAVSARCATLGQRVRVILPGGEFIGRALRLAEDGRLVVQTAGEERIVAAGDIVHLRSASED